MNKKYKPGVPIVSLDQLMQQEQVLFIPLNKVFSYGWFASWQMRYAMDLIKKRWLYVAVKKESNK
jgi:hypothetical protein